MRIMKLHTNVVYNIVFYYVNFDWNRTRTDRELKKKRNYLISMKLILMKFVINIVKDIIYQYLYNDRKFWRKSFCLRSILVRLMKLVINIVKYSICIIYLCIDFDWNRVRNEWKFKDKCIYLMLMQIGLTLIEIELEMTKNWKENAFVWFLC